MRFLFKSSVVALVLLGSPACGGSGGSGTSTPASPTTPTTPTNKNPVITSMDITAFGIQQLTAFQFSAVANDPDGDPLSYAWDVAGSASSAASGSITFSNGGSWTARLTVTDGKGGSATDTRSFVCGTLTGKWSGTFGPWVFTSNLVQTYTVVTGDYVDQLGAGKLDPASANTIDANGNVKLRYKLYDNSDFTVTGVMDATGRKVTGVVNGSGYVNTPFTATK